jgi:hypothetical protein
MLLLCLAALCYPPPAWQPERAKAFHIEQIVNEKGEAEPTGYIVYLSRSAAERLALLLTEFVDEEELAKAMDEDVKQLKNRIFFHFAKKNFKQFKKDLLDKLGTEGAKVTVTGQRPLDMIAKDRTDEEKAAAREREKLIQSVLPGRLKTVHSMINTVPGKWAVEPLGRALHPDKVNSR